MSASSDGHSLEMDPEIELALLQRAPVGAVDLRNLDGLRRDRERTDAQPHPHVRHSERVLLNTTGSRRLRLRFHEPPTSRVRPCIYWIHGGGYVMGSRRSDEDRVDEWVLRHDVCVVTVEYRLAPEHRFPAAFDDCRDGLTWLLESEIAAGDILVAGASAGGGLAAALALWIRDEKRDGVAAQMLIYPMLDDRIEDMAKASAPRWTVSAIRSCWQAYLGSEAGGDEVSARAAAAREPNVDGLVPTFVAVGAIDLFCDAAVSYASRLLKSKGSVELHVYPGAPHGFDRIAPTASVSRRLARDLDDYIRHWRATQAKSDD